MARRNEGAHEVEALSTDCRRLASELRAQATTYSFFRRDDADELRQIAGRLDMLGDRITKLFSEGDDHGLRRVARWVQSYSSLFMIPGAFLTAAAGAAGVKTVDAIWPGAEEAQAVVDAAQQTYERACIVIELPAQALRHTVTGTVAATQGEDGTGQAHGDLSLSSTGSDATSGSADVPLELSDAVGITDTVTVAIDPGEVQLEGVDVEGLNDPAPAEAVEPEIHETSGSLSAGAGVSVDVSKGVSLGQAVERDQAPRIDATARPAPIKVTTEMPMPIVSATHDESA